MSEIHPSSTAYEQLKQFCFRIGEGRIEPREDRWHYIMLYHPIHKEDQILLVHYDGTDLYVREFPEEMEIERLEDLPLVHSFNGFQSPLEIFPFVVDVHEEETTYHYSFRGSNAILSIRAPLAQYKRLKSLFDKINPMPWVEREDPRHILAPPVIPDG